MAELTKQETAAMWLWGEEYAKGGLSAKEFYARLPHERRQLIDAMLRQIAEAR